jgi:hypothetical protein
MAARKIIKRVATLRQSFSRPNIFSIVFVWFVVEVVKLHPIIHLGGHPVPHRERLGNYTTSSDTNRCKGREVHTPYVEGQA